ncbi:MAG: tetratricopeptide repeat protein [Limisphaerales bacterium]
MLTYEQVKKRARQVAEVTARCYMPPWPPEPGYGEFADSRRLTANELGMIQQWVAEGAEEGNPSELPSPPTWTAGWQLGTPDLIVTMPEAYTLPAEGKDVYRNFVFPIPVSSTRYVQAVEFRPGNARVVHHAFIDVDETRQSLRLAQKQTPPGFDGMELPESAIMPAGQFLGWQPGKAVYRVSDGLAWTLKPATDLVLQMHMHPTGKPEAVQPTVGFYFTDQAPTNLPFRLRLLHYELDIPPGADNYVVEQSYVLPIDVTLLRVNPHAHYLGKDLQGYALLPTGEKRWLLWIKAWDFNWQGDYQYARPVALPRGTKLVMRYTYDNSTNNVRNPNQPPKRVRHGLNVSDEMAALGFQALARTPQDRETLSQDYQAYLARVLVSYFRFHLRLEPDDAAVHTRLAWFLLRQGQKAEAMDHVTTALKLKPDDDQAHYALGYFYLLDNRIKEAYPEFQTVIRLNPQDSQSYGNLGLILLKQARFEDARKYLETALRLNPDDLVARRNLGLALAALGRR